MNAKSPLPPRKLETAAERRSRFKPIRTGEDYLNSPGNNVAFVLGAERLFGVGMTERTKVLRVILMELSRIMSHLVWLGTTSVDIGAFTPFLWLYQERENIYNLLEGWVGARLTTTATRVGGMAADLPDGWLSVPVGAPCNVCDKRARDRRYASIGRMRPDGTGYEVIAEGVRNTVGFDWHPDTKQLWFTDNGRDWMGDDQPGDELNVAPRTGLDFGFPYCHAAAIPDPEFGGKKACADTTAPARVLGPHVAALGMRFYTGTMFPQEYRRQIFIAEHVFEFAGEAASIVWSGDGASDALPPHFQKLVVSGAFDVTPRMRRVLFSCENIAACASEAGSPSASGASSSRSGGTVARIRAWRDSKPSASSIAASCDTVGPMWRAWNSSWPSSARMSALGYPEGLMDRISGAACGFAACMNGIEGSRGAHSRAAWGSAGARPGRVGAGVEQRVDLRRIGRPHPEQPAVGVGRFVDRLRGLGERRIHCQHLAGHWRVDVGGRLGRLDDDAGFTLRELAADFGQFDVDQFAERVLGVKSDAHRRGAVGFEAKPLVRRGVAEIGGVVQGRAPKAAASRPVVDRKPPLSVCLRHSAPAPARTPVSFGEACTAVSRPAARSLLSREPNRCSPFA